MPVAMLSAMLGPELLLREGRLALSSNPGLWVALPTFAVAVKSKCLLGTVAAGVGLLALTRALGGF